MKTVGIIAEYNPFHTGHKYHIQKAKEASGADYAVIVMSPDFVQRGEPAVFDKYSRTRMALLSGADLVLQLPVCYAAGSAEYFAEGAVSLLNSLGIIDTLCFGGESDNAALFNYTASVLNQEPASYLMHLKNLLRQGYTYPKARSQALSDYLSDKTEFAVSEFLSTPNNILGLEYCRALQKSGSPIIPLPISRIGSQYNSSVLSGKYASATAIRNSLKSAPSTAAGDSSAEQILSFIPHECREIFLSVSQHPVTINDFSLLLSQKLIYEQDFSSILDISPELSDRINSLKYRCLGHSAEEIIAMLKTKQMTEARIRRALLHVILNISSDAVETYRMNGTVFYARILGFRKESAPLLHELKKKSSIAIISKNSAAESILQQYGSFVSAYGPDMWEMDMKAAHLYHAAASSKYHTSFRTEYEYSPVVL